MSKTTISKTQTRIITCALTLFKERGYNNVTIQDICKYAEITKSTFYYHFPSKEALIEYYTDEISQSTQENFSDIIAHDSYIQQLWALFNSYTQKNNEYGVSIVNQVYSTMLSTCDEIEFPKSLSLFNTVVIIIQKAQKAKEINNLSLPSEIAKILYYGARGIVYSWAAEQGAFSLEDKLKDLFNTLLLPTEEHVIII
ncbi:TetR/AcrR family transcriptional regulator [Clostridium saccharoperbutylacetonicum]|uniref:TetR/AcrR family transcriptional regulator n=1 Tax=Clostridium saccharoperbutylacetonicum TaxID=36745 RepID=UPI0039E81846